MDWHTALVIAHIVGVALGVGGATFVEVLLLRSLRDGVVDQSENALMHTTYDVIRVGFFILVLSGFGFLLLARIEDSATWFYSVKLWAKLGIVGIIALNAALLQLRWILLAWGSAISITSWYAALVLGALKPGDYSYFSIYMAYAVSVVIVYFALKIIHKNLTRA